MSKPLIDLWANFLFNERLDPKQLDAQDTILESRALVCETAINMGLDLTAIKRTKNGMRKMAMSRGLLDSWNEVYRKRFGSTDGTPGQAEITRRTIVTKLLREPKD